MKKKLILFFLVLIILSVAFAAYDDTPATCEAGGYTWMSNPLDYESTYSFTSDTIGGDPSGWSVDEDAGTINVISSLNGHSKVVEMHDTSGSNALAFYQSFTGRAAGTVEFYVRLSTTSQGYSLWISDGSFNFNDRVFLYFDTDGNIKNSAGTIMSFNANQWYHIKIEFDTSNDWHLWINGESKDEGMGYSFTGNPTSMDFIVFETYTPNSGYYAYIDAIGYSWDSGYSIGDNLIRKGVGSNCCGDDNIIGGEWDNFYNASHICYNGIISNDGDANKEYCQLSGNSWSTITPSFTKIKLDDLAQNYGFFDTGDLNGDNFVDIVTIDDAGNYDDVEYKMWVNNKDGTFTKSTILFMEDVGSDPHSIGLGDLNGDNSLDIVAFEGSKLRLFFNNGTGSFSVKNITNWDSSKVIKFADLDADGDMDFLTDDFKSIEFWENNDGLGNFTTTTLGTVSTNEIIDFEIADIDGDDDLDILSTQNDDNTLIKWVNNGGSFSLSTAGTSPAYNQKLDVGDIDLDGDIDAVVADAMYEAFVVDFINDGSGAFTTKTFVFDWVYVGPWYDINLGDADNDGDLDAITGYSLEYWENNDTKGNYSYTSLETSGDYKDIKFVDLDSDGDLDILGTYSFSDIELYMWENTGLDGFNGPCCGDDGYEAFTGCYQGNLDNDEQACESMGYTWMTGTITGSNGRCCGDDNNSDDFNNGSLVCLNGEILTEPDDNQAFCESLGYNWLTGTITGSGGPCCGDDAQNDIFYNSTHMCSYGGVIFDADNLYTQDWYGDNFNYSSGKGVCELKGYDWVEAGGSFTKSDLGTASNSVRTVALGDLDGDGDLDIVSGDTYDHVYKWVNDGTGSFVKTDLGTASGHVYSVALGDLDGDGDLDIVSGDTYDHVYKWVNDGTGSFVKTDLGTASNSVWTVALGDLDGDGDLDIVSGDADGHVYKWVNDGTGSFAETNLGPLGGDVLSVALGDVDGDGDLDIISGDRGEHVYKWVNDGTGSFTESDLGTASDDVFTVALGDVNNNGYLDIISGDYGEHVYKWVNDGTGSFTESDLGTVSDIVLSVALGDVNNDGYLDIISGDTYDHVYKWVNDGTGSFVKTDLGSVSDIVYTVALGDLDGDGDLDIISGDYGNHVYKWVNDGLSGSNGPCCGDDGDTDDFENSTTVCLNGLIPSDGDLNEAFCYANSTSNIWFTGEVTGSNYRCCGDDESLDYFGNSSACCSYGVYTAGACPFSPAGCLSEHIDLNEDYEWSTWPSDDCGLVNCTDFAAIDEDVDYVWDGYCYSGALNTSCISGSLPPFNTSFTVTVRGNLTELGTDLPVIGETITITAGGVDYTDVTDSYGGWSVEVLYWELNCATSNTVIAEFSKDDREYSVSEAFTAVK